MPQRSGGVGKGLRSALLAQEPSFAALCGECHVLAGAVTLLGARPRRGSGHGRAGRAGGIIPKAWHVPRVALGTRQQGHLPPAVPVGCRCSPLHPAGMDKERGGGAGSSPARSSRLRFVPTAVGQAELAVEGQQSFVPGLLILAAKGKWDQSGREGKEEATARDLLGWGAGAARPWGEALSYLWLVRKKAPWCPGERGWKFNYSPSVLCNY